MLIIIADVNLKHTDVNINLVLFWTSISYKEYSIWIMMKINKYSQKQLQILFIVRDTPN